MTKSDSKSSPTLDDVARAANVSPITVSRALRMPDKVSAATRERVMKAVAETHYVPNIAASMLASQRSTIVAAIFPNIANTIFTDTLSGISEVLKKQNYTLVISDFDFAANESYLELASVLKLQPCGLFLHNTEHSKEVKETLRTFNAPIFELGDFSKNPIDSCVSYSNFDVGFKAVDHLFSLGYRSIAFASVKKRKNIRVKERQKGYKAGLAAHGLEIDNSLVFEGDIGTASGAQVIDAAMASPKPIDAIFFAGERMGVGASLECSRRGIDVPGRLALLAVDDYEIGQQLNPPLSAIAIPRREIGRLAAEALMDRLSGQSSGSLQTNVGFQIIDRGST